MTEAGFHLKHHLTSFQIMILGFAGVILLGALVLMLPISAAGGGWTPFHEALFTSTSAVCVTGLVVQDTGSYWSGFGQTVILLLIQIGGLGVITAAITFLMLSGRNISLKERSAMQDAISAPAVGGIVRLTRFVLMGTFLVELVGALALLPAFCRDYGLRGVWLAVFHSVSAFCNAGFDILGRADALYPSLTAYMADPLVNIVIMLLIVVGGIGFLTWDDVCTHRLHLRRYRMQSKVILSATILLIALPALLFFLSLIHILISFTSSAPPFRTMTPSSITWAASTWRASRMRVEWVMISSEPCVRSRNRRTPSLTVRTASTSRPESVSSRMASLGASISICKISAFFFSPPEKPFLFFHPDMQIFNFQKCLTHITSPYLLSAPHWPVLFRFRA